MLANHISRRHRIFSGANRIYNSMQFTSLALDLDSMPLAHTLYNVRRSNTGWQSLHPEARPDTNADHAQKVQDLMSVAVVSNKSA
ncbi:hypothetical protein FQZ97_335690 [compost metagenome]